MSTSNRLKRRRQESPCSASSTSIDVDVDEDNDSFTLQPSDSQSSLNTSLHEAQMLSSTMDDETHRFLCQQSPIYRLPPEVMIAIFSRLVSVADLLSCMLVSKEWARNSVALLWHRPSMGQWHNVQSVMKSVRKVDKMFTYENLVRRLNMSSLGSHVSDACLLGMVGCKRIERLTLTTCSKVTDVGLNPLLVGNKSLVALDITDMIGATDVSLSTVAEHCTRLQGLNVAGCLFLTDVSIVAVIESCRQLKRIKLNCCKLLTDKTVMAVAANSTFLLEIDLMDLQNVESGSIAALIESCQQLRELRLMRCIRIDDTAFINLPMSMPPQDALRVLDLTECVEICDRAVEKIVVIFPRLRNLLLAKCRNLTDRAAFAITKLGKNLHYLHLGHCVRLTDDGVKALARSCTRIRYIDLAGCTNLTDAGVMQLAAYLPKLKRVGLVKCSGITDRSVLALATFPSRSNSGLARGVHNINALERVHLSYCSEVTLDGIHCLLNNCPRLTHLSLTGVQAILRDDITRYSRPAPEEFLEHQRPLFRVFSGPDVGRLRKHLNMIKERHDRYYNYDAEGNETIHMRPHTFNDDDDMLDEEDLEEDEITTPDDGDDDQGLIIHANRQIRGLSMDRTRQASVSPITRTADSPLHITQTNQFPRTLFQGQDSSGSRRQTVQATTVPLAVNRNSASVAARPNQIDTRQQGSYRDRMASNGSTSAISGLMNNAIIDDD